jgi:hypothetical protein
MTHFSISCPIIYIDYKTIIKAVMVLLTFIILMPLWLDLYVGVGQVKGTLTLTDFVTLYHDVDLLNCTSSSLPAGAEWSEVASHSVPAGLYSSKDSIHFNSRIDRVLVSIIKSFHCHYQHHPFLQICFFNHDYQHHDTIYLKKLMNYSSLYQHIYKYN